MESHWKGRMTSWLGFKGITSGIEDNSAPTGVTVGWLEIQGNNPLRLSCLDEVWYASSGVLTTWSLTPKCPQQIEKALQTGQLYFAIGAVGGMKTAAVLLTIFPPSQPETDFFFFSFPLSSSARWHSFLCSAEQLTCRVQCGYSSDWKIFWSISVY